MDVCRDYCVLSGRGLCDALIKRPEESYRQWCVVLCDLETSWMISMPYNHKVFGRSLDKERFVRKMRTNLKTIPTAAKCWKWMMLITITATNYNCEDRLTHSICKLGYGLEITGFEPRWKQQTFLQITQKGFRAHQASSSMGTGVLCLGEGGGISHLAPSLRMRGSMPPLPLVWLQRVYKYNVLKLTIARN